MQQLEKATVLWYFISSPSNVSNTKFRTKVKILKFDTALIGCFGLEFQKNSSVFEISTLEFVNMQSYIQKQKKLKCWNKNTLFRYFWDVT